MALPGRPCPPYISGPRPRISLQLRQWIERIALRALNGDRTDLQRLVFEQWAEYEKSMENPKTHQAYMRTVIY